MGQRVASYSRESIFEQKDLWIKSPAYDLSLVTGGAFFTLFVATMSFLFPLLVPVFFWIWVVVFEGSHFWASFSRTYLDSEFRKKNQGVLYGSLVFFIFPALALAGDLWMPEVNFPLLYGFFIFLWSLYHNARQHYGFFSIYAKKAQISSELKDSCVRALYASICFAQAHFLFNLKLPDAFSLMHPLQVGKSFGFFVYDIPILLSIASLFYLTYLAWKSISEVGVKAFMPIFYILVCWVFYTSMFYWIAPQDHFVQTPSGVETFMLIAIMNSLFHNIQYHAIVYYYGKRRYQGELKTYGMARFTNGSAVRYLGAALLLGVFFGWVVWSKGDWPNLQGEWLASKAHSWAYIIFFGIVGHHFFLDQKIWRPSKSQDLRRYLQA